LKRRRDDFDDEHEMPDVDGEEDVVSQDDDMENGGVGIDGVSDDASSEEFGSGDEISFGDEEDEEMVDADGEPNEKPKRQRTS
jgi:hypothetical protein